MNIILILTTEGCEACNIAKRNVDLAVIQSNIDIEVQVKDYHELDKKFLNRNKIKDYPTVLYMIDTTIINKTVGTYPSAVYLRWIDMYFKN